jgi:hypothetical protein
MNKMLDSLIFIWTIKEKIYDVLKYFESIDFKYVESIVWATLDSNKLNNIGDLSQSGIIDLNNCFLSRKSEYFSNSKMTVLVFRYTKDKKLLELRHQRSTDVVFSKSSLSEYPINKPKNYIYDLIDTLLPQSPNQCKFIEINIKTEAFLKERQGWINFQIN